METPDARYTIAYNGEIYNFPQLRAELEGLGHTFRSRSDTEILLAAWSQWGETCLNKLNGIFAFALWDAREERLALVRDPLGVKPLYWTRNTEGTVYFGSEIRPLRKAPGVSSALSRDALNAYVAFLWVPSPKTIFQAIEQLDAGTLLVLKRGQEPLKRHYSDLDQTILSSRPRSVAPEELWAQCQAAVKRQMMSDVPVGAFLSGGLDSTGIVAACEDRSKLTAYTISFSAQDSAFEAASNDLSYAKEAARFFGIEQQVIQVDPKITEALPHYLARMDHPVGDHAPLASYLICEAARKQGAKVLLSGQGADEVFGGYPWHKAGLLSFIFNSFPSFVNNGLQAAADALPGSKGGAWQGHFRRIKRFVSNAALPWPERYPALCRYLTPSRRQSLLAGPPLQDPLWPESLYLTAMAKVKDDDPLAQMLYADLKTFLPGLNLFYTDRTSMAHGVEVRVPYLDLDMVRLAFQIPSAEKNDGFKGKKILTQALSPHLPKAIVKRKKAGFGLPVRSWMRASLGVMLRDRLTPSRIQKAGLWNPAEVQGLLDEHFSGREDRAYLLFALLALDIWQEQFN